jgi:hypothetical protein
MATVYAMVVFCMLSYVSVMFSLLSRPPAERPVTNIGFPYSYYYQFWTRGSNGPNCGWVFSNFILDAVITWFIIFIVYFAFNRNKS